MAEVRINYNEFQIAPLANTMGEIIFMICLVWLSLFLATALQSVFHETFAQSANLKIYVHINSNSNDIGTIELTDLHGYYEERQYLTGSGKSVVIEFDPPSNVTGITGNKYHAAPYSNVYQLCGFGDGQVNPGDTRLDISVALVPCTTR